MFVRVPYKILEDNNLLLSEKIIFALILNICAKNKNLMCTLSNEFLANRTGVSFRTTSRAISKLEELKYIDVEFDRNTRQRLISVNSRGAHYDLFREWMEV